MLKYKSCIRLFDGIPALLASLKAGGYSLGIVTSKSFALVLSCIVGAFMGLCVCFCLIYNVCSNGYIKTDLDSLGIFMLCIGCFMAGGGINKALAERKKKQPNGEAVN